VLHAEARGLHLGRRTALFDVDVQAGDRLVARFGCTQLIVEPGPAAGNQP
jgi:acyl-coenzyme A thioesterase PaaI-like protein